MFAARAHGARELAEARDVSHTHTSYTFELLNVMRYSFVMRVIILYSFKAREYLPIYCMLYERFTDFPDVLTVIFFQNKIVETVTLVVIYDYRYYYRNNIITITENRHRTWVPILL